MGDDSEQEDVGVIIARLRKRYAATETPKCRLCGHKMAIGMAGEGRIEWHCDSPEADWLGMEEGKEREEALDHYRASAYTQVQFGDEDVIHVLDALWSLGIMTIGEMREDNRG